jgi:hypothetical protein
MFLINSFLGHYNHTSFFASLNALPTSCSSNSFQATNLVGPVLKNQLQMQLLLCICVNYAPQIYTNSSGPLAVLLFYFSFQDIFSWIWTMFMYRITSVRNIWLPIHGYELCLCSSQSVMFQWAWGLLQRGSQGVGPGMVATAWVRRHGIHHSVSCAAAAACEGAWSAAIGPIFLVYYSCCRIPG